VMPPVLTLHHGDAQAEYVEHHTSSPRGRPFWLPPRLSGATTGASRISWKRSRGRFQSEHRSDERRRDDHRGVEALEKMQRLIEAPYLKISPEPADVRQSVVQWSAYKEDRKDE
jgi:hypothetical protein